MEIRYTASGQNSLSTKVFYSDESGFAVSSVIVMGKKDCILLDAQWTLSSAHRVISEIVDTGKNLTTIFCSHAHPDHYFGAGVIAQAFPKAKVVAIASEAALMNTQFFGKLEHWEGVIGAHNVCRLETKFEALPENSLELEGQKFEILTKVMGDMRYNTMVWMPSIKTLYASDVLFNEAHPFTCECTKEERAQWIVDVDKIEKMGAEVIIPGHQKPGMQFDKSSLDFTRDYIRATEEVLLQTETEAEFFLAMFKKFPDAVINKLSNGMNAAVFKGGLDWNWRNIE